MVEPKITVKNIGKAAVASHNHELPIISISDRYTAGVAIPGEKIGRSVLRVDFFAGDHFEDKELCITEEIVKEIYDFVNGLPPETETLLVNCGEGCIRSNTICDILYRDHPRVKNHLGDGVRDRYTYHIGRLAMKKLSREENHD